MKTFFGPMSVLKWLAVLGAATTTLGCGDSGGGQDGVGQQGDVVGGPCASGSECADGSVCIDSGDFPGGMCSIDCATDNDCPGGSVCISNEGGVCMLTCTSSDECRGGYLCEDKSKEDGGGDALVCNGN